MQRFALSVERIKDDAIRCFIIFFMFFLVEEKTMKRKLRIAFVSLIAIVITFLCCTGAQCKARQTQPTKYGDFYYSIMTDDETGEQYIRLQGLTEQGQQKKYVIVPSEINGIKVRELNYRGGAWYYEGNLYSEQLEKIYLPYGIKVYRLAFNSCKKLKDLILFHIPDNIENINYYYAVPNIYISSSLYDEEEFGSSNLFECKYDINIKFANVSFMYNFGDSPYAGYYWIDNLDYGTKIEYVPEDPVRDGYEFGGWYKEPECVTEWNFKEDTLPEQAVTDEGDELYQETRLYAKWI